MAERFILHEIQLLSTKMSYVQPNDWHEINRLRQRIDLISGIMRSPSQREALLDGVTVALPYFIRARGLNNRELSLLKGLAIGCLNLAGTVGCGMALPGFVGYEAASAVGAGFLGQFLTTAISAVGGAFPIMFRFQPTVVKSWYKLLDLRMKRELRRQFGRLDPDIQFEKAWQEWELSVRNAKSKLGTAGNVPNDPMEAADAVSTQAAHVLDTAALLYQFHLFDLPDGARFTDVFGRKKTLTLPMAQRLLDATLRRREQLKAVLADLDESQAWQERAAPQSASAQGGVISVLRASTLKALSNLERIGALAQRRIAQGELDAQAMSELGSELKGLQRVFADPSGSP